MDKQERFAELQRQQAMIRDKQERLAELQRQRDQAWDAIRRHLEDGKNGSELARLVEKAFAAQDALTKAQKE
jgi:hypothetical protein